MSKPVNNQGINQPLNQQDMSTTDNTAFTNPNLYQQNYPPLDQAPPHIPHQQQQQQYQPPNPLQQQTNSGVNSSNSLTPSNQQHAVNISPVIQVTNENKATAPTIINTVGTTQTSAYGAMHPVMVTCPSCQKTGTTRMSRMTINWVTILWFLCSCAIGIICCIPGCCPSKTTYKHYCSACGNLVGRKDPTCC